MDASVASAARRQDYPRHLANALIVELAESARGERVRASQLAAENEKLTKRNDTQRAVITKALRQPYEQGA